MTWPAGPLPPTLMKALEAKGTEETVIILKDGLNIAHHYFW